MLVLEQKSLQGISFKDTCADVRLLPNVSKMSAAHIIRNACVLRRDVFNITEQLILVDSDWTYISSMYDETTRTHFDALGVHTLEDAMVMHRTELLAPCLPWL